MWAHDASPNLGVRVLGAGTEALVRRVWPQAEVVFTNYGARTAPVPLGSWKALAKESVTRRAGLADWFGSFDLAIDTRSGDSFASIYGRSRLVAMSAAAEFAHRSGVPVLLAPQTIGPFEDRISRGLARRSLRTASLVMSRDSTSTQIAADLGRPVDVRTTDLVFALDPATPTVRRDVVLNISGLLWAGGNSHVDSDVYRSAVRGIYRGLVAQGRTVSLLAHVIAADGPDTDMATVEDFAADCAPEAEVLHPVSLADVRTMLAGAELVIGSRMHACLNALSVGTPPIALAYSRKFAPLLGDLGWSHVLDLRDRPDQLVARVLETASRPGLDREAAQTLEIARARLESATRALAHALTPSAT